MGGLGQNINISNPGDGNVTPPGFLEIFNEGAIFYIQALFALSDQEIGTLEGFSADLMYSFFNFIVKHRGGLCKDIERGDIQSFPNLPEHIRDKMAKSLHANRNRAAEVHRILSGTTKGLALRLWPYLQHVVMSKGGGFANTYKLLSRSFLNGVSAAYPRHGATEAFVGM